jgi:hypothetical protein
MSVADAKDAIRQAERETHLYYQAHHDEFRDRGYRVMYGPPLERAPILFIGYQPGGDQRTDDHRGREQSGAWPALSDYATEAWTLARNMQSMFGIDLLRRCIGLNAIFFRSPNIAVYATEVSLARRRDAAAFCVGQAKRIIEALRPKLVVTIGFKTLELFSEGRPALSNAHSRTLLIESCIAGMPAIGTLHLSGCRIAAADRKAMAGMILARAR